MRKSSQILLIALVHPTFSRHITCHLSCRRSYEMSVSILIMNWNKCVQEQFRFYRLRNLAIHYLNKFPGQKVYVYLDVNDMHLYISKNCFIAMSLKVINVNLPRIMFLWRLDQSQIMHLSLVFSDTYYVMFTNEW